MIMVTNNDTSKLEMGGKNNTNHQEKPRHLKYLNEFRTQQCLFFLNQQCQFHRPYTCFDWHFPNQKRRRPFKRIDGTFNYNPDVYCDKYDETSGSCVDGDDCPYAHRNAGDTERRYHPRYFKTGNCIYETTENGACVKNGLHCAFAHGPDDVRLPVYDIREVQDASSKFTVNLPASLEKERVLSEDPKWNEMFHVLACYKTELCKKPPRMCRQGYSCPFYHNGKDKRRAPDRWRYRSTPCPIVRPGDEWLDSGLCDAGDTCTFCHTRTEQQFHPEIYKSTKCNDVINSGYCPRGPFCAFAHCDSEISTGRDFLVKQQDQLLSASGINLGETSPRNAAFPSGLLVPNLMSPLTNLSGPALSTTNTGSARGRRMGRCSSPHQNLGLWQTNAPNVPDRVAPFLSASTNAIHSANAATTNVAANLHSSLNTVNSSNSIMSSNSGSSSNNGGGGHNAATNPSNFLKDPAQLAANAMLSLGQTTPTSANAGFLPFYPHRPVNNLFQNVITNSMALNAAARDKGRHRSGSSVSSSDGGLFVFNHSELTSSSSSGAARGLGNTSTPGPAYQGRGGPNMIPGPQSIGSVLRPVHTGGKAHPTRNASKKLTGMIAQQQQHQQAAAGPPLGPGSSFFNDRSAASALMSDSPSAGQCGIRSLMNSDSGLTNASSIRTTAPHSAQYTAPAVPLLQNTLWSAEPVQPDRLLGSTWPWPVPIDSGHNSEASMTDLNELPQGLYDLPTTTTAGSVGGPTVPFGLTKPNLDSTSQRDSGLILDFASPTVGDRCADSSLIIGPRRSSGANRFGSDGPDNQLSPDSLQDLIGKSESFLRQLHSTPNRARSGTIVGHPQRFYPSFVSEVCPESLDSVSQTTSAQSLPGSDHQLPGFHSPLDDILLQSQSYLESQGASNNLAPRSDTSPVFDSGLSGSSDPMSIPGRGLPHERSMMQAAPGSDRFRHSQLVTQSEQRMPPSHHNSNNHGTGSGVSTQENTWPITGAHTTRGSPSSSEFAHPGAAASQTSLSFSPIVGTPANVRISGAQSTVKASMSQSFGVPPSQISQTAMGLESSLGARTGNAPPMGLNMSSSEQSDTSDLLRTSGLTKPDTSSDSPKSQVDSSDPGISRATGSANASLLNGNYPNWPQSPILMSSPFNNPGYELERLSLQRELDEVRQRLDSKEDELEAIRRQRDFVAEHLRDSLGVIQKLFHSFHVSPPDLSHPLYVETDHAGTASDPSTGYSATGLTASEASPMPEEVDEEKYSMPNTAATARAQSPPSEQSPPGCVTNEVLLDRRQLQQQQEALAALFANPFVSALLSSASAGLEPVPDLGTGLNTTPLWANQDSGSCARPAASCLDSNFGRIAGAVDSSVALHDSKSQPTSVSLGDTTSAALSVSTGSSQNTKEVQFRTA